MSGYLIRRAENKDIPFLADLVITAEKSGSDKLSFSTLFNIPEAEVKDLVISMFEEEIEGCEFSVNSYLITEYAGEPVAGFGAWLEGIDGELPSGLLKSNLVGFTFGKEHIAFLRSVSEVIKDILAEREQGTLQMEYLFVSQDHRGKGLADGLIQKLEENALSRFPALEKIQVQVYSNNVHAVNLYQRNGFEIAKTYKSGNKDIFNYLPFNEKCIMEKKLKRPDNG